MQLAVTHQVALYLVNADAVCIRVGCRIFIDNYSSHRCRRLLAGYDRGISRYARHRDGLIRNEDKDD